MSQTLEQYQASLQALENGIRLLLHNALPQQNVGPSIAQLVSFTPDALIEYNRLQEIEQTRLAEEAATLALQKKRERKQKAREQPSPKERKKRNLKDLSAVCKELGDASDKSALLVAWKQRREQDEEWSRSPHIMRLRKMIHDLVSRLERHLRSLQSQKGKTRNIVREQYWEASPLTSKRNSLQDFPPTQEWTPVAFESWTLYVETQILLAALGTNLTFTLKGDWDLDYSADDGESDSKSDADNVNFDSDTSAADSDASAGTRYEDRPRLAFYHLAPEKPISIARFATRTLHELQRMSKLPGGAAPAFELALTLRIDVLYQLELMSSSFNMSCDYIDEVHVFLLHRLIEDRDTAHPEFPIDAAGAVYYINEYVKALGGIRCARELGDLLELLWPLAWRDVRGEYRIKLRLAVGRKLPADVCEIVLDWIEAKHAFPRSQGEYVGQIEAGGLGEESE